MYGGLVDRGGDGGVAGGRAGVEGWAVVSLEGGMRSGGGEGGL